MRRIAEVLAVVGLLALVLALAGCGGGGGVPGGADNAAGKPAKPPPAPLTNPALCYSAHQKGLMVATADGSMTSLVWPVPSGQYNVAASAWSPDGRRIAFFGGQENAIQELRVVNADGSGDALIRRNESPYLYGGQLDWCPVGDRIIFDCYTTWPDVYKDLWVIDPQTGSFEALGLTDLASPPGHAAWPRFGPDLDGDPGNGYQGLVLFYCGQVAAPRLLVVPVGTEPDGRLRAYGATTTVAQLAGTGYPVPSNDFSANGRTISFFDYPVEASRVLKVVDVLGMDPPTFGEGQAPPVTWDGEPLTSFLSGTACSPDGRWIAFVTWVGDKAAAGVQEFDVFRVPATGGAAVRVTPADKVRVGCPAWNPAWANDLE